MKEFLLILLLASTVQEVIGWGKSEPISLHIKHSPTTVEFSLETGRYVLLKVEQESIDVVCTLLAPDGKVMLIADSPLQPSEELAFITEATGKYRLEVKAKTIFFHCFPKQPPEASLIFRPAAVLC